MLVLAALAGVSAFFAWGRKRWESPAKISDATFLTAAIVGTAFLILSMISGFLAWPWDRLWHTPMVYSKVTYAVLGLNFWVVLILARLKYGDEVWRKPSLSVPMLAFTLLAFVAVLMAGSAGGHLGHGASILDALFSGFNPYLPIVLAPWWSVGFIAAGSYFMLRRFIGRKKIPMTKWVYVVMVFLFVGSAGVTKLLWKEDDTTASRTGQMKHKMEGPSQPRHEPAATKPTLLPAEGAGVKILSPKEGQLFKSDKVPLRYTFTKGKRGAHLHAYVDRELMGMFSDPEKGILTGISPGHHTLELRAVAEDHQTELDASDKVGFMVK